MAYVHIYTQCKGREVILTLYRLYAFGGQIISSILAQAPFTSTKSTSILRFMARREHAGYNIEGMRRAMLMRRNR